MARKESRPWRTPRTLFKKIGLLNCQEYDKWLNSVFWKYAWEEYRDGYHNNPAIPKVKDQLPQALIHLEIKNRIIIPRFAPKDTYTRLDWKAYLLHGVMSDNKVRGGLFYRCRKTKSEMYEKVWWVILHESWAYSCGRRPHALPSSQSSVQPPARPQIQPASEPTMQSSVQPTAVAEDDSDIPAVNARVAMLVVRWVEMPEVAVQAGIAPDISIVDSYLLENDVRVWNHVYDTFTLNDLNLILDKCVYEDVQVRQQPELTSFRAIQDMLREGQDVVVHVTTTTIATDEEVNYNDPEVDHNALGPETDVSGPPWETEDEQHVPG